MDTRFIRSELSLVAREMKAKGSMGKIRDHAKKHGEKAFDIVMSELDDIVGGSREWNEVQKDLFRTTALEAFKTKLEKKLR